MAVALLMGAGGLLAQRATVSGLVLDPDGVILPGARVELLREDVIIAEGLTDEDGRFTLAAEPGSYQLRVRASGFRAELLDVTAGVGQSQTITVRLRSGQMAKPTLPPPPPPPPPPVPPPIVDPSLPGQIPVSLPPDEARAIVPVFYATDRARVTTPVLSYTAARNVSEELALGRFDVSIPRDAHQVGIAERPSVWTLWREDPNKHFVIVRRQEKSYEQFYREVSSVVAGSKRKEAFVFVHGFNVPFEDAVYRTAQMAYDLAFDGAPILYSWPSIGTLATYSGDVNNSKWTAEHLRWFLEDVATRSGASAVHLIAHSMGNAPLVEALNRMATMQRSTPRPRFRQIVLTAPDIDAGLFRQMAAAMTTMGDRVTLYASANDRALELSKSYQGGYPRAGDTRPEILRLAGIDSVDVSAVDTNFIGHFYYAENRSVLSDIMRLFETNRPPVQRCGMEPAGSLTPPAWRFVAGVICPL